MVSVSAKIKSSQKTTGVTKNRMQAPKEIIQNKYFQYFPTAYWTCSMTMVSCRQEGHREVIYMFQWSSVFVSLLFVKSCFIVSIVFVFFVFWCTSTFTFLLFAARSLAGCSFFCFSKGPPQAAFLSCGKSQISLHSRPAPQLGNKDNRKTNNEKHIQIKHGKKKHENHAFGNKTKKKYRNVKETEVHRNNQWTKKRKKQ